MRLLRALLSVSLVISFMTATTPVGAATSAAPPPEPFSLPWSQVSPPEFSSPIAAAYGDGLFVAVDQHASIIASADGSNWRLVHKDDSPDGTPGFARPNLQAITYGAGRFVAVGSPNFLVMTSTDSETWTSSQQWEDVPEPLAGTPNLNDVVYGGGRFVAVGGGESIASTDGVHWSHSEQMAGVILHKVAYGGNQFVAVGTTENGQQGGVWASADGLAWTPLKADPALPPLFDIVYSQGRFVMTGHPLAGDVSLHAYALTGGAEWTWSLAWPPNAADAGRVSVADGFFFMPLRSGGKTILAISNDFVTWTMSAVPAEVTQVVAGKDNLIAVGAPFPGKILTLSPCSSFLDLPAGDPACPAVKSLKENRIIAGYPDGTFRPTTSVSRAEFAKMLVVALGKTPVPDAPLSFPDTVGSWAAEQGYIQAAVLSHAISGYPDGTFRPGGSVTRAEMIRMVAGAANIPQGAQGTAYSDVTVSDWFAAPVNGAVRAGLIGPAAAIPLWLESTLHPNQQATREEAAMVLYNLAVHMHRAVPAGLYPPDYRTGVPKLDAVIDGFLKKDADGLMSLIGMTTAKCKEGTEAYCGDNPEGTERNYFARATCQVSFLMDQQAIREEMTRWVGETRYLYAAYSVEGMGKAAYYLIFANGLEDQAAKNAVLNADGQIILLGLGCGAPTTPLSADYYKAIVPPKASQQPE